MCVEVTGVCRIIINNPPLLLVHNEGREGGREGIREWRKSDKGPRVGSWRGNHLKERKKKKPQSTRYF